MSWSAMIDSFRETLAHHPHLNPVTVNNIPLIVEERAVDMFGHNTIRKK